MAEFEKILSERKLTWYKIHNYPGIEDYKIVDNCIKVVSGHYGFIPGYGPSYSDVELFDLRYIDTCTLNELFDKYF